MPPTKPCQLYLQGKCHYGGRCRFMHEQVLIAITGDNDRRAENIVNTEASNTAEEDLNQRHASNDTKNKPCRYVKNGSCKFGSRCRYSHDPSIVSRNPFEVADHAAALAEISDASRAVEEGSERQEDTANASKRRTKVVNKPCFKWEATGRCNKGDTCAYSHDPSVLERLAQEESRRAKAQEESRRRTDQEAERRQREQARRDADERRKEEERVRQAELKKQRDEEQARKEAERTQRQEQLTRADAARRITRDVDNCLITFGAGLTIDHVIPGFDVSRGRIPGLAPSTQPKDLVVAFESLGIDTTLYTLDKPYRRDIAFLSISTSQVDQLQRLQPLHGVHLKFLPFKSNLDDDAQSSGSAFGRTLSVNIYSKRFDPPGLLDALQLHLGTHTSCQGLRASRREGDFGSGQGDSKARILLEFDTWENAQRLREGLRQQRQWFYGARSVVWNNNLFLPSKFQHPLFIPSTQYAVQRTQWTELSQRCKQDGCELKIREFPDGKVRVGLYGDDLAVVGPMKVRAEQIARGTTINLWNRRLFDSAVAQRLTDDLRDATGALVQVDRRLRCLRAYGSSTIVEHARERLELFAAELARNEYTRELPNQRLVRFFVEVGYPQLKETYDEDAVVLDLTSTPRKITVTGDEEIRHRLDKLFDDASRDWTASRGAGSSAAHDCPICMCPVSAPTTLTCGHVYCTQCLTHFVKSALEGTSFPLRCAADEGRCAAPIAISQLERFLHAPKFQQLLEAAFHAYMEQNPNVLGPCRTPGCAQLFAREMNGRKDGAAAATCPACFVKVCRECANAAHQGVTCEMAGRDPSEEYINNSKDIRRCPACRAPIFKEGGCNHVSCRCGRHICWRCSEAFATSELCYTHMRERHGGYFDYDMRPEEEPAPAARAAPAAGAAAFAAIPAAFIEEDARARALARAQGAARERLEQVRQQREEMERAIQLDRERRAYIRLLEDEETARRFRERHEQEARRAAQNQGSGSWCVVM